MAGDAQSEKVLGEFNDNDTIAADAGMISQLRVRVSLGEGSVGSENNAEAVRKGHEAMSEGVDKAIVTREGT